MKLYFVFLFFITFVSFSQKEITDNEVYLLAVVDKKPEFPGGTEALTSFIAENIDLPYNDAFDGGKIIVSFTVNEDGVLSDIKIVRGLELGVNNEIIRLFNICKNWIPGEIDNKKVRVNFVLPVVIPKNEMEAEVVKNYSSTDPIILDKDLEVKPEFIGGIKEFYNYVGANFRVPIAKDDSKGKVLATFVIEKDGTINDIKIIKDEVGHGCAEEFTRVLKECPKWSPGKKDGVPVKVFYSMPINIQSLGGDRIQEKVFYDLEVLDPNGKPKYTEGIEAFYNFIYNNINKAKIRNFRKKVNVYFTISDNGEILKVHVEEKVDKEVYNEISRVVKLSKKWIPAIKFGKKVNCYLKLPISIGY
jgi:Gram-negative bacterial TonB protein C-terminal